MFHLQEYFADAALDAYNLSHGYLTHQVSLEAYELQNEKEVVATLMYILLNIIYSTVIFIHLNLSKPSSVICSMFCTHQSLHPYHVIIANYSEYAIIITQCIHYIWV